MLEQFAARTVEAQELERRRVAGEIHDGISQRLISLWYHLLAAEDADRPGARAPGADRGAATSRGRARRRSQRDRRAAAAAARRSRPRPEPREPGPLGSRCVGAGRASTRAGCRRTSRWRCTGSPRRHCRTSSSTPAATRLQLRLAVDDRDVRLTVRDDGRGFEQGNLERDDTRPSYGIVGMHERADLIDAVVTITSAPGMGTTVEVVLPRDAPSEAPSRVGAQELA